MYFLLSLLLTPSIHPRLGFTSTWTSIFLCLLLPFTGCSIYIAHSQTVHGNELSASLRHSHWCGRRAASLSLSVSAFVFMFGERKSAFLNFFPCCSPRNVIMQMSEQTKIHKHICLKVIDIHASVPLHHMNKAQYFEYTEAATNPKTT